MNNLTKIIKSITLILFCMLLCVSCDSKKELSTNSDNVYKNIPFSNDSKVKKYMKLLNKYAMEDIFKKGAVYITVEDNFLTWKVTGNQVKSAYIGKISNGKPTGDGIICTKKDNYWIPVFAGEFKNGNFDGYIIEFDTILYKNIPMLYISAEGEFKKGSYIGNVTYQGYASSEVSDRLCSLLSYVNSNDAQLVDDNLVEELANTTNNQIKQTNKSENIFIIPQMYPYAMSFYYSGNTTKGVVDNKGKFYYNRTLIFDGSLSNGVLHGKGILYNKDGSIQHEGKWKNGQIK